MTDNRGPVGELLAGWVARSMLRPLDRAFALFLQEQVPDASPLLVVSAAVTSFYSGLGHSCIELPAMMAAFTEELSGDTPVSAQEWYAALNHKTIVDPDGAAPLALTMTESGNAGPPVVRLYLKRYFRYERTIRDTLRSRLFMEGVGDFPAGVDTRQFKAALDAISLPSDQPDWQRIACALALRSRFSVITGGPGTGKTTTVIRILALLQGVGAGTGTGAGPESEGPLIIRLAAPTGKAAARLQESITAQLGTLPESMRETIPREVVTLHRLLRLGGQNRSGVYGSGVSRSGVYGRSRRLPADVVVVDEASMMDVEMTTLLLQALPEQGRLILLGDKDQLASVEAGAVLSNLCARVEQGHYTPQTAQWVAAATGEQIPPEMIDPTGTPLDQTITMLRRSHRFAADSEIGRVARAVRDGDASRVADLLTTMNRSVRRLDVSSPAAAAFRELLHPYLTHIRSVKNAPHSTPETGDTQARTLLQRYREFQVLCALRDGPWGVVQINELVEGILREEGLIPEDTRWYAGRPVIVTRNEYRLGVMNGDVGVALSFPEGLRVAFDRGRDQDIHWVLPSRLHAVESVFAMTVHKSQGSEFNHVVLVLPDRTAPVLTRELLYTGITRTRNGVTLVYADPTVLEFTVRNRVERTGGLGDMLQTPHNGS